MKRITTLAAAVLLVSALPLTAQAHPDAYVGASIGNARLDDDFGGFGIDEDTGAYRFSVAFESVMHSASKRAT